MTTDPRMLAVETDTALAEMHDRLFSANMRLSSVLEDHRRAVQNGWHQSEETERDIQRYKDEIASIHEEMSPLEEVYEQHRWTRIFLVANPDGHFHKSMYCSTTYPTTAWFWMPEFSGLDEAGLVEQAGERACTVCYPSAPVDKPSTLPHPFREDMDRARREREEAKTKREQERIAKAVTASGEPLVVFLREGDNWSKETLRTERTARIWAVDALADLQTGWITLDADWIEGQVRLVAEALAEKHGTNVEQILTEFRTKAAKKAKTRC